MSKLIAPTDLDCFATCDHAAGCPNQEHSDAHTQGAAPWSVPEVWQTCSKCRDLVKARVVNPASASGSTLGAEEDNACPPSSRDAGVAP